MNEVVMNELKLKLAWKWWEFAYSASWYLLGDMPFTWDMKAKRNNAFFAYNLNKQVD